MGGGGGGYGGVPTAQKKRSNLASGTHSTLGIVLAALTLACLYVLISIRDPAIELP
jgi:hypothetical protein